ncbi:MAG: hypothetical protein IPJ13_04850 [Saprospiraceae bacterium]|nr:hypothetical protein [Saprospiraceae bacterium]
MGLLEFIKKIEFDKEEKSPMLHTAYDAFFTFAYAPDRVTKAGTHIKDGRILKRLMVVVVIKDMHLCYLWHIHYWTSGTLYATESI